MMSTGLWPTRTLGDIAHFYAGSSLPQGEPFRSQQGGYLLLRVSDLNLPGNETLITTANTWSATAGPKSATCPPGSLVIPKRGGAIGTNKKRLTTRPCVLDPNLMAISPSTELEVRFLYHWFLTFDLTSITSGTSVPQLNKRDLSPLLLPVPPIDVQRRIAASLDAAGAVQAKRHKALALVNQLAESIFLSMFGDPATNPNGWPVVELNTLVAQADRINYGVVQPGHHVDHGVPLVRVSDLIAGEIRIAQLKRIDPEIEAPYRRSRLRGDEVLVSCVGSIGIIALADEKSRGFNVARAVARVPLGTQVDRLFVATQLTLPVVQRYFTSELRTVSQPTLNIKQLGTTPVMVPPLDLQRQFAQCAGAVRIVRQTQGAASEAAEFLMASLVHRAFAGEL